MASEDTFNPLFQEGQVLKPRRRVPAGVSAADKHRSLKAADTLGLQSVQGTVKGSSASTVSPPFDASPNSGAQHESPPKKHSRAPRVVTQHTEDVERAMIATQRAVCAAKPPETDDVFDVAYTTQRADVVAPSAAAPPPAVVNGTLAAEDFDF